MQTVLWGLVALVTIAISLGSLDAGLTRWPPGISPAVSHVLAYACLGAVLALGLSRVRRGALWALGLTMLFGTGIELAQLAIPARRFGVHDLAMNALGAVVGVGLARLLAAAVDRLRNVAGR